MKQKESLVLVELLMMIAVFVLAAGLCLQLFAGSVARTEANAALDHSVVEAQNAAELLMHTAGDFSQAAETYGGTWDGSRWCIYYSDTWERLPELPASGNAAYVLTAIPTESPEPYLGKGEITVSHGDGTVIFTLPAAWQLPAHR